MLETGKQQLKKENILVHFWKIYQKPDCLCDKLLLVKPHVNDFNLAVLRLDGRYLTNKNQRTNINTIYKSWDKILFGIPQKSLPGQKFSIYLFVNSSSLQNKQSLQYMQITIHTLQSKILTIILSQ